MMPRFTGLTCQEKNPGNRKKIYHFVLLSRNHEPGKICAQNNNAMKHSSRAWLPGILLPAMMLIVFALSACRKGDTGPQQPAWNADLNAAQRISLTKTGFSIKMQKDGIRLSEYETVTQYPAAYH